MDKKVNEKPKFNLKEYVLSQLRGAAIKTALRAVLGSAYAVGFKAWIVKFIVGELWDHIGDPIARLGIRKGLLVYDKVQGRIMVKKFEEAKKEGNETAKDDLYDNV